MNIFVLDHDIEKSVAYHNNWHVCKMPTEAFQILITSICSICPEEITPLNKTGNNYKPVKNKNHGSCVWARTCRENFQYTLNYFELLCQEYNYRYGKENFTYRYLDWVYQYINRFDPQGRLTKFYLAMPDQYKLSDTVLSYRQYYLKEKMSDKNGVPAKWTKRSIPFWTHHNRV
ncbi:MAG: hypothetical protein BAJALOKI3v1_50043 [Promethearchaeota archaeon]|nr:MAG: hypothetical protein BAJALOKI3v1_50043 [Candidatus Lokiarchaeota archaeon]